MQTWTFTISLRLRAPLLTRSSAVGRLGVDAPMAVNSAGRFMLPASLVKGRLRQSWIELRNAVGGDFGVDDARLRVLLGHESEVQDQQETEDLSRVEPQRGRLHFEDFECPDQAPALEPAKRHRIRISPLRQAVDKGMLQVAETAFPARTDVTFVGKARCVSSPDLSADQVARWLRQGLRFINQIGGERTVGFGRLTSVEVKFSGDPELPAEGAAFQVNSAPATQCPVTLEVVFKPKGPFCLTEYRYGGNVFKSGATIPGNAIKGCLAAMLGLPHAPLGFEALARHFDQLRIRHAFPTLAAANGVRPARPPLSLVRVNVQRNGENVSELYDVALTETAAMLHGKAPAFRIDWKGSPAVDDERLFHWVSPATELRVRTAMDSARRMADKTGEDRPHKDDVEAQGKLFALQLTLPWTLGSNDTPEEVVWCGAIDLGAIPRQDREAAASQLRALLGLGLHGLGKTKTFAAVRISAESEVHPAVPTPVEGPYCVTLQTPALICDPRYQELEGVPKAGALTADALKKLYADVWATWSRPTVGEEPCLNLRWYYATQSLLGGNYLHRRFQPGTPYNPWLLTDAGSVFVLEAVNGKEEQARKRLEHWLLHGLPLPRWARLQYGGTADADDADLWNRCPFIPQNGFGEILVNQPVHQQRQFPEPQ